MKTILQALASSFAGPFRALFDNDAHKVFKQIKEDAMHNQFQVYVVISKRSGLIGVALTQAGAAKLVQSADPNDPTIYIEVTDVER
jgi:hypothetical protein